MKNKNKFILNILSASLVVVGIAMIPSIIITAVVDKQPYYISFMILSVTCIIIGTLGYRFLSNDLTIVKMKYCYLTTFLTWFLLIILSALPFYMANSDYGFISSVFEASAGWSTTGASVLDPAILPNGLLFWKSTCNWLGGIGIVMLSIIFLPNWKYIGQSLAFTELPGPGFLKTTTTFRASYKRLLFVYCTLTFLQFAALTIAGVSPFYAIMNSLSNVSTAGIQYNPGGITATMTTAVEIIIAIFSILSAMNYSIFFLALSRKGSEILKNTELKVFFMLLACSVIFVALMLYFTGFYSGLTTSFRESFVQVSGFATTSGYTFTNYYDWPEVCKAVLLMYMFIGACAVSTGGGIKIPRFIILIKMVRYGAYKLIYPRRIKDITINGTPLRGKNVINSSAYVLMFMGTLLLGALFLSIDNINLSTSLYASLGAISNTGASLGQLANTGDYSFFSDFSKVILSLLMVAGRLEIYPLILMFSKSFWKTNSNL